jgi:hypothetical protein
MKKIPDVSIEVDGKKCINLKRMLCCNSKCLEDDECVLNCCVVQNITNEPSKDVKPPTNQEQKPPAD